MAPSLGVFSPETGGKDLKDKISYAIRQVEVQRRELEQLRFRLEERRRAMFDSSVRAIEKDDEMRARVLAGEHVELQKIARVVNAAEIALLQISVRMETIRDVGDVMYVLSNAFKTVKKIGKQISEVAPNLEQSASEINQSLSNILSELGVVTPNISIGISDSPYEIFEKAQKLINERASELSELPRSIERLGEPDEMSIFERTKKVAELATEGDNGLEESEFKPILLSSAEEVSFDPENQVRNYIKDVGVSNINVTDASAQLNLPVDLVEQAYIEVLREDRFNARPHRTASISPEKN
ncbi:MAG: hypothetical protein ACYC7D_10195 [Nitrososphaerales archaeon]